MDKITLKMNRDDEAYLCCVDEIGDVVKQLVRNMQLIERDQIKSLGFTITQCYTLIELLKCHTLTMHDLSERMNLNSSTMTRIVDKLVRDKYISRTRSPEDRRVVVVSLTEKGLESAETCNESITKYYESVTRHLPEGKIQDVLDSVSLLMEAFNKSNPNCC